MGRIYRAYDNTLHRMVAVKFLRHHNPAQMARFRQEASSTPASDPAACS